MGMIVMGVLTQKRMLMLTRSNERGRRSYDVLEKRKKQLGPERERDIYIYTIEPSQFCNPGTPKTLPIPHICSGPSISTR